MCVRICTFVLANAPVFVLFARKSTGVSLLCEARNVRVAFVRACLQEFCLHLVRCLVSALTCFSSDRISSAFVRACLQERCQHCGELKCVSICTFVPDTGYLQVQKNKY